MKVLGAALAATATVASAHDYKICSGTADGFGLTAVELSPDPVPSFAELKVAFTGIPTHAFDAGSTAKLTVKLLGIKLATLDFDACKDLGMTCPVPAGKLVTGSITYKVPTAVPAGLSANVELVMTDGAGAAITCVDVKAKLGKAKSKAMTAMARPADEGPPPPPHDGEGPPQAPSTDWAMAEGHLSCDEVCSERGSSCDGAAINSLTTQDRVFAAFAAAGFTCQVADTGCETRYGGNHCDRWGSPYLYNQPNYLKQGRCFYGLGSPHHASCSQRPVDGNHRRLCPCESTTPTPPLFLATLRNACPMELGACLPTPPPAVGGRGEWVQTPSCVAAVAAACPSCFEGVYEARIDYVSEACIWPCVMANWAALRAAGCRKPPHAMRERFHDMHEARKGGEHGHRRRSLHGGKKHAKHEGKKHVYGTLSRLLHEKHDHDDHRDEHHRHDHDDHHPGLEEIESVASCFQQRLESISAPCAASLRAVLPPAERQEGEALGPEELELFFRLVEDEAEARGPASHCGGDHHHRRHHVAMVAAAALLALVCACCVRRRCRRKARARAEAEASWAALADPAGEGIALGEVVLTDGTPMVIIGEKLQPIVLVAQQ